MIHVQQISRSFGVLALAGLSALLIPANCLAQGYTITTVAGGGDIGGNGVGDGGPAVGALLLNPAGMAIDSAGNLYVADANLSVNLVRKVAPNGIISTIAGINEQAGYTGDGGPATRAELNGPSGLVLDSAGNLYIADTFNDRVRKVAPNGTITTVAGGGGFSLNHGDGGLATLATLSMPQGIATDAAGNLYIADTFDYRVRKVDSNGRISTVAGSGQIISYTGGNGDGGPATSAFVVPYAVAVDSAGNLYVADGLINNRVRKVTPDGVIATVAGSGAGSYSGDGGPATQAGIYQPSGVAVDSAGNIFIADTGDERVRRVGADGTISTIAGTGELQTSGDGGPAASAALTNPFGVLVTSGGVVYVSDQSSTITPNEAADGRVRKLTPVGGISTSAPAISSGGIVSAGAFGAFSSVAPGSWIEIYGSNLASDSRSWTGADFTGVNAPTSLDGTKVTIGGQLAFIDYISPTQVNAQVPSNVATGSQPVIVTSAAGSSVASTITVNQQQPGLLAPSSFIVGGKQYVAALFSDGVTFVLPPGAIAGVPSRRAKPGDAITLYGIGFGAVTPNIPAGQIVQQTNTLTGVLHVLFGQTQAVIGYDGLAPNAVGLYQFNVVVPNMAASDTVPVTFTLGGVAGTQTLYIAVQN
jgi:uncharacterized protein (TIGR03437 family)